ncbi:MAG: sigma-70 family RNA polymerase sigma factor [Clostridia bacterium]|nr:sigma-70 family RNA polymerase sigma factor [Clostridia bacterium]
MEDYQIVDLYWARSESAIEQTKTKYGRTLTGISFSLVSSREDAEECVNDTYLAAWNSMPTERPTYLGAFLAKIVRRLSVSRYRLAHAEKRGGAEGPVAELTDCIPSSMDVEKQFENGMLTAALNRFIEGLDKEKRYMFLRRYFYSDSVSDIAASLGAGEGRVKTTLHRIRLSLHDFLEKEGLI